MGCDGSSFAKTLYDTKEKIESILPSVPALVALYERLTDIFAAAKSAEDSAAAASQSAAACEAIEQSIDGNVDLVEGIKNDVSVMAEDVSVKHLDIVQIGEEVDESAVAVQEGATAVETAVAIVTALYDVVWVDTQIIDGELVLLYNDAANIDGATIDENGNFIILLNEG